MGHLWRPGTSISNSICLTLNFKLYVKLAVLKEYKKIDNSVDFIRKCLTMRVVTNENVFDATFLYLCCCRLVTKSCLTLQHPHGL